MVGWVGGVKVISKTIPAMLKLELGLGLSKNQAAVIGLRACLLVVRDRSSTTWTSINGTE